MATPFSFLLGGLPSTEHGTAGPSASAAWVGSVSVAVSTINGSFVLLFVLVEGHSPAYDFKSTVLREGSAASRLGETVPSIPIGVGGCGVRPGWKTEALAELSLTRDCAANGRLAGMLLMLLDDFVGPDIEGELADAADDQTEKHNADELECK